MAHPNEELTRRGFDAFAKGDVDTLRELFDHGSLLNEWAYSVLDAAWNRGQFGSRSWPPWAASAQMMKMSRVMMSSDQNR